MNPAAGGAGDTDPVETAFAEAGGRRVRRTSGRGDARRFAAEAAAEGAERIVVAGGDGTLREVVAGLADAEASSRVRLGLIPLGTGNDLARSLGVPDDPREAVVAALAEAGQGVRIRKVDLLRVHLDDGDAQVALNAVIIGEGGAVGEALEPEVKARWGPLSYLRGAVEVALDLQPRRMAVRLDEGAIREASILNVVAANGRFAGHGVPIAPGAHPDDGHMDVVVLDALPLTRLVGLLPALLRGPEGEEPDDPSWHQDTADRLTVTIADGEPGLPVSVDGENTSASRIGVTLDPGVLRILTPGSTD